MGFAPLGALQSDLAFFSEALKRSCEFEFRILGEILWTFQQREISHEAKLSILRHTSTAEQTNQQMRIKRDTAPTPKPKGVRVGGQREKKEGKKEARYFNTSAKKAPERVHRQSPVKEAPTAGRAVTNPPSQDGDPAAMSPLDPEPQDLVLMLLICLMSPSQFSPRFPSTAACARAHFPISLG